MDSLVKLPNCYNLEGQQEFIEMTVKNTKIEKIGMYNFAM
jgi:hypothetical protein